MRTALIDPHTQTITELDYSGNWEDISKHIKCDMFTIAAVDRVMPNGNRLDIYVDDEGLFKNNRMFKHKGYPEPLAGYGLVMETDKYGEAQPFTGDIEELKESVQWL